MTAAPKEWSRLLSRLESMRLALASSNMAQEWERVDLANMAEAAAMLWDQAETVAAKHPEAKPELSEALARLFEPLLMWRGQFGLCAKVATARAQAEPIAAQPFDAPLARFEALAFKGRFEDDRHWDRETSFGQAQRAYADLLLLGARLDDVAKARAAHAWFLIGLQEMATRLLLSCDDRRAPQEHYRNHRSPAFWRDSYLSLDWLGLLRDVANSN